jgi:hypothetical protein
MEIGTLVLCLLLAQVAPSRSTPIDGTWSIYAPATRAPQTSRTYIIQNGRYRCVECDPKVDIKADGTLQPITAANADHLAVTFR